MRNFLVKRLIVLLLIALGYLGWRTYTLSRENADLRDTVLQLENERRALRQRLAEPSPTAKTEDQGQLRGQIEARTSALRRLPFRAPVCYRTIERSQLKKVLVDEVNQQYSEQELRDYARSLAAVGLIPAGTDLLDVWLGMYGEQVGAFYLPEEHALYTFRDLGMSGSLDKMVLAHELTHALQDQHFQLDRLPLKVKDNDDLALATAALIEGDATVVMAQFYLEQFEAGQAWEDLGAMLSQNTARLVAAPAYLREMLLFPYQQGQGFATALLVEGGLAAVDDAFRDPPVSTEQILHPQKYTSPRDEPEQIHVPDLVSEDWRPIGNNVVGEFGVQVLFRQALGLMQARVAAAGWDGDRYHVYERDPDEPTALVWVSAWDTEQDAEEFERAYQRYARWRVSAENQPGPALTTRVRREGKTVLIQQTSDPACWEIGEGGDEQ